MNALLFFSSLAFAVSPVARAENQGHKIQSALEKFHKLCGSYPSIENGLAALLQKPKDLNCPKWHASLKKVPYDPWGHPWLYESDSKSFKIISLGQDGKEGGINADRDLVLANP